MHIVFIMGLLLWEMGSSVPPCKKSIPNFLRDGSNHQFSLGWNDFVITLLREFLYVICFNIRCIIWCLAYIFNLRPLKAKLRIIEAFGTFWQFLAIFAFLAELDNSKHFEPYFFFGLVWPFSALWPWKGPKAKMTGLLRYI